MDQITTKAVPREACLEILKKHADTLGLSIYTEWKKKDSTRCICFHVIGPKSGRSNEWFCFAVVMTVPELKLGV